MKSRSGGWSVCGILNESNFATTGSDTPELGFNNSFYNNQIVNTDGIWSNLQFSNIFQPNSQLKFEAFEVWSVFVFGNFFTQSYVTILIEVSRKTPMYFNVFKFIDSFITAANEDI